MKIYDSSGPAGSHSSETWLLVAKAENAEKNADAAKCQARLAKRKFKLARRAFKLAKRAAKRAKQEAEEAQKALAAALEQVARPSARKPATTRKRAAIKATAAGAGKNSPATQARKKNSRPAGKLHSRQSTIKSARKFVGKRTATARGQQTVTNQPKLSKPQRKALKESAVGAPIRKRLRPTTHKAKAPLPAVPQEPGGLAPTDMPVETPSEGTAAQTSGFEEPPSSLE